MYRQLLSACLPVRIMPTLKKKGLGIEESFIRPTSSLFLGGSQSACTRPGVVGFNLQYFALSDSSGGQMEYRETGILAFITGFFYDV